MGSPALESENVRLPLRRQLDQQVAMSNVSTRNAVRVVRHVRFSVRTPKLFTETAESVRWVKEPNFGSATAARTTIGTLPYFLVWYGRVLRIGTE